MKDTSMRTPMRRVRGLGAAHSGTHQFWHQRITAVAGIPLTIAAIIIAIGLLGRSHAAVVQILGSPIVAIIMLLFIVNIVYHMWIGMQEIILAFVRSLASWLRTENRTADRRSTATPTRSRITATTWW
jgi:succinate dehydrogenase / fumarate reductase membrane anchor subunit